MPNPRMPLYLWTIDTAQGHVKVTATTASSAFAKVRRQGWSGEMEAVEKTLIAKPMPATGEVDRG